MRIDNGEEDGKTVTFLLLNKNNQEIYLTLFNIHNGHYSNGFVVTRNGDEIKSGNL